MRRLLLACLAALCFPFAALAAVNINTADQSELETLPGIGASKAVAIIQYRTDHGAFKSVDELDNVSGIGPSTLASIRDLVTVGGGTKPAVGSEPASATSTPAPTSTPTTSAATTTSAAPPPAAPDGACPVNINKADAAGLDLLPGIGASKAAAIIDYRTQNGPFASCNDLNNVTGIGDSTLSQILPCCSVK